MLTRIIYSLASMRAAEGYESRPRYAARHPSRRIFRASVEQASLRYPAYITAVNLPLVLTVARQTAGMQPLVRKMAI